MLSSFSQGVAALLKPIMHLTYILNIIPANMSVLPSHKCMFQTEPV